MELMGGYVAVVRDRTTERRGNGRYHGGVLLWLYHELHRHIEPHGIDMDPSLFGGSEGVLFVQVGSPWLWFFGVIEPSRLAPLEGPPRGQGCRATGRPSPPQSRRR